MVFRIPADEELKLAWIQSLNLNPDDIKQNSMVCSQHFKQNDWERLRIRNKLKRYLKPDAVPLVRSVST